MSCRIIESSFEQQDDSLRVVVNTASAVSCRMIESSCTLEDDSLRVVAYCRMTTRCYVLQDDLRDVVHYRIVEDTNRQVGCPRMNCLFSSPWRVHNYSKYKGRDFIHNSFAKEPVSDD